MVVYLNNHFLFFGFCLFGILTVPEQALINPYLTINQSNLIIMKTFCLMLNAFLQTLSYYFFHGAKLRIIQILHYRQTRHNVWEFSSFGGFSPKKREKIEKNCDFIAFLVFDDACNFTFVC